MKSYRIQLASNYQVVEFNLEIENDEVLTADHSDVASAIDFVNALGKLVEQPSKATVAKKPVEKKPAPKADAATKGQIEYLVALGMDESDAKKLSKKEANIKIKELMADGDE